MSQSSQDVFCLVGLIQPSSTISRFSLAEEFPQGVERGELINFLYMSRILVGIHFGDSFIYGLYSGMVNGKRKILAGMFTFGTFMARIIWDRSLSFLTVLSWV